MWAGYKEPLVFMCFQDVWNGKTIFLANVPISYPLETSENQRFFNVFRGCGNWTYFSKVFWCWGGLKWELWSEMGNKDWKKTQLIFVCSIWTMETSEKRCSKLTIKIPERLHWYHSGVFIVNLEQISHLLIMLTLSRKC